MQESIFIKGARENNLKNIDVEIPRDKLVVINLQPTRGDRRTNLRGETKVHTWLVPVWPEAARD